MSNDRCSAVLQGGGMLLLFLLTVVSSAGVFDEVDTYHGVVVLQAGTASFNATQNYSAQTLRTLSNDICSLVLPLFPTPAANLSLGCFVSFETTPTIEIHLAIATRGVAASYPVYSVLTGWTSASTFTPLANVRQKIFTVFNVPASSTTFVSSTTTIPCRSQFTRPGATSAPTLPSVVCADNFTKIPVPQDLVLISASTMSASALSTALCDVLGTSRCAKVSIVAMNQANSQYQLLGTTIRFSATISAKMSAVLTVVDAARRRIYPSFTALGVQRVLLVPPSGTVGNTSATVSVFSWSEGVSPNSPPEVMFCNRFYSYWTFILIIFGPILYIVFRHAYHSGKKKGIQLERQAIKEEEELREAEEQQREQQLHRSASNFAASQDGGAIAEEGGDYPAAPLPPMDPSQWDPAMVAYVQQMMAQQQAVRR